MNCATRIIDGKLGGTRKASELLGVPASTVQSWKEKGRIPLDQQANLILKARGKEIDVSTDELVPDDVKLAADGQAA